MVGRVARWWCCFWCVHSVAACDLCSVLTATEARESRPGWSVALAQQYTRAGTLSDGGHRVDNPSGQACDNYVTQLSAGYRFAGPWGVSLTVPAIHRAWRRPDGFAMDRGSLTGLGDASVQATWRAYDRASVRSTLQVTARGGLKLPTGSPHRLREELDEREVPGAPESGLHGHDLALGSGSVDALLGASLFARRRWWVLEASVGGALRTPGSLGYRYASDLQWRVAPGHYLCLGDNGSCLAQWVVSGETKGLDTFRGAKAEDTGLTTVSVGPSLSGTWGDRGSAELAVEVPVLQHNSALQVVGDWRLRLAGGWRF